MTAFKYVIHYNLQGIKLVSDKLFFPIIDIHHVCPLVGQAFQANGEAVLPRGDAYPICVFDEAFIQ